MVCRGQHKDEHILDVDVDVSDPLKTTQYHISRIGYLLDHLHFYSPLLFSHTLCIVFAKVCERFQAIHLVFHQLLSQFHRIKLIVDDGIFPVTMLQGRQDDV